MQGRHKIDKETETNNKKKERKIAPTKKDMKMREKERKMKEKVRQTKRKIRKYLKIEQ